jgi:formate dehydrogenase assembly factor FdhD
LNILKRLSLSIFMMLSVSANAAVLTYTFDSGSYFDLGSDNKYSPSGIFKFDDVLNQVTFVDFYQIQTGTGPTGPFHFTSAITNSATDVVFIDDIGDHSGFIFASSLAGGGTIKILSGNYSFQDISLTVNAGGSVSVAAVPEPSITALGLFGLGLMGFVATRRKA